jgi:hypothetical protein
MVHRPAVLRVGCIVRTPVVDADPKDVADSTDREAAACRSLRADLGRTFADLRKTTAVEDGDHLHYGLVTCTVGGAVAFLASIRRQEVRRRGTVYRVVHLEHYSRYCQRSCVPRRLVGADTADRYLVEAHSSFPTNLLARGDSKEEEEEDHLHAWVASRRSREEEDRLDPRRVDTDPAEAEDHGT